VDAIPAVAVEVAWEDIVELVDGHPLLSAGRHDAAAARAAVEAAAAAPNPSLAATAAYALAKDGSGSAIEWGLGLSIPLGWVAGRRARSEAAGKEAMVVDAVAGAVRMDVLLELQALYWSLVYEQGRSEALAELDLQMDALVRSVSRRVESGEARPVEATLVEIEAEEVAGELERAGTALAARRAQLAIWLRVRGGRPLVATGDLSDLPTPMTAERARELVRSGHPSVIAAAARIDKSRALVEVERRSRLPSFALEAFTDQELDRSAYGLGAAIDLPGSAGPRPRLPSRGICSKRNGSSSRPTPSTPSPGASRASPWPPATRSGSCRWRCRSRRPWSAPISSARRRSSS
jgi:outer membrane protein TolC